MVMQAGRFVEDRRHRTVFGRPQHPYTKALLAAAPRLEPPPDTIPKGRPCNPGSTPRRSSSPAAGRPHRRRHAAPDGPVDGQRDRPHRARHRRRYRRRRRRRPGGAGRRLGQADRRRPGPPSGPPRHAGHREHAEALAEMEATDVGKPLTQARADVTALARYCEFYAGAADKVMGQTIPFQQGFTVYTLREPIGVTGHIVPWNYPMQIIGRSLGAALAMGNACVLKPAEEACLTALAFADLARQAGFRPGAINVVPGLGAEAGPRSPPIPGRPHLLHRLGRHGPPRAGRRRAKRRARHAGAGRQVPAAGLRRRRSRRGPALPRERGAPERGADLFGLLPHPCRAQSASTKWPIAWPPPTAPRSAPAMRTGTSAPSSPPARRRSSRAISTLPGRASASPRVRSPPTRRNRPLRRPCASGR
jgi:hypothetical protein